MTAMTTAMMTGANGTTRATGLIASMAIVLGGALGATAASAQEGTLRLTNHHSHPAAREVWDRVVAQFEAEHPDIEVDYNLVDNEGFKTTIRNVLQADPPDVLTWYTGNRAKPFVDAGLFADVSDLWEGQLAEELAPAISTVTFDGSQYGVPTNYNGYGLFARQDILDEYSIGPIETWDDLLAACGTLGKNDVKAFTIGTKYLWTAAAWFDYLNLRQNGYDFHMALTRGEVPWTDDRVRAVFDRWGELVQADCFIDNHPAYDWQGAVPFLINGDAAMYLIGTFAVDGMKEALGEGELSFIPFPTIDESVPMAEEAPTEGLFVPSGADNPEAGRAFLRFAARPDVQMMITNGEGLVVNVTAEPPSDPILRAASDRLQAAEGGLAQFFDRDAPAQMAQAAMEGFQEFMVRPERLDAILERLEGVRARAY